MNCILCSKSLSEEEERVLRDHCLKCDVASIPDPNGIAWKKQKVQNHNLVGVSEKVAWAIAVAQARKEEW